MYVFFQHFHTRNFKTDIWILRCEHTAHHFCLVGPKMSRPDMEETPSHHLSPSGPGFVSAAPSPAHLSQALCPGPLQCTVFLSVPSPTSCSVGAFLLLIFSGSFILYVPLLLLPKFLTCLILSLPLPFLSFSILCISLWSLDVCISFIFSLTDSWSRCPFGTCYGLSLQ